jgi:tetratricopeptide (TPR) repeat protein
LQSLLLRKPPEEENTHFSQYRYCRTLFLRWRRETFQPAHKKQSLVMSTSHQMLSEVNNLGASCIDNGNLSQAMRLFQSALQQVKEKFAAACPQIQRPSGLVKDQKAVQPLLSLSMKQDFANPIAPACKYYGDSTRFIYTRGMQMPTTPDVCFSQDIFEDGKIRSSIIVFNLGIVYHVKGLYDSSPAILNKAKYLYEQSYYLIVDTIRYYEGRSTGNAVIDLLFLALMNNLAQISVAFLDYSESEVRFDMLIQYAFSFRSNTIDGAGDMQVAAFVDQQICSFVLNAKVVMGLLGHRSTTAPAA